MGTRKWSLLQSAPNPMPMLLLMLEMKPLSTITKVPRKPTPGRKSSKGATKACGSASKK
jgi:hypothetical protein